MLSIALLYQGVASIIGCLLAAIITDRFHPKYAYLGFGIFGLFLGICCCFLSSEAEREFQVGEQSIFLTEFSSQIDPNNMKTPDEAKRERRLIIETKLEEEKRCCYNF